MTDLAVPAENLVSLATRRNEQNHDALVALVASTVNRAVTSLLQTAEIHELVYPAAAAQVEELAQRIAGVTVDAIRDWPALPE